MEAVEGLHDRAAPEEDPEVDVDDEEEADGGEEDAGFVKFPSIEKFRHLLKSIPRVFRAPSRAPAPATLTFRGTVKLHGTNAGVVKRYPGGALTIQSRNRVIARIDVDEEGNASANAELVGLDNAGCRAFLLQRDPAGIVGRVEAALAAAGRPPPAEYVAVFGEFCGSGVQRHVAIAKLPKMFVIFAVKVDGRWLDLGHPDFADLGSADQQRQQQIFNVMGFRTETVVLDVGNPEPARLELERLTGEVDAQCPVAMQIGNVVGPGEGWVWQCLDIPGCQSIWFKTKGEAHAKNQKKPGKAHVAAGVERAADVAELIARHVDEALLLKGASEMGAPDRDLGSLTAFIRWVSADLVKEEADTMEESGLSELEVRKGVGRVAAAWFKARCAEGQVKT